MEVREGGKEKDNDSVSTVLKYISYVQVVDTRMCIESC
jgi:hypothetical protein